MRTAIPTVLACVACCNLMSGCTSVGQIAGQITYDIVQNESILRKKVALVMEVPVKSQASELSAWTFAQAKESLAACSGLIVVDSAKLRGDLAQVPLLVSGMPDNLEITRVGRTHGVSVVVDFSALRMDWEAKEVRAWGVGEKKAFQQARVAIRAKALDVETGTIVFEETASEEVSVSQQTWMECEGSNKDALAAVVRLRAELISRLAKRLCKALDRLPWKGYVVATPDKDRFEIRAGADAGLVKGDVLEAFGLGESIKGYDGQVFFLPGTKVGELSVTKVEMSRAEAEKKSATGLSEPAEPIIGHVRLKPRLGRTTQNSSEL